MKVKQLIDILKGFPEDEEVSILDIGAVTDHLELSQVVVRLNSPVLGLGGKHRRVHGLELEDIKRSKDEQLSSRILIHPEEFG